MLFLKEKLLYAAAFLFSVVIAWFLLKWLWGLAAANLTSLLALGILIIAATLVLLPFRLFGALFSWVWFKNR